MQRQQPGPFRVHFKIPIVWYLNVCWKILLYLDSFILFCVVKFIIMFNIHINMSLDMVLGIMYMYYDFTHCVFILYFVNVTLLTLCIFFCAVRYLVIVSFGFSCYVQD